jgi:N-alpha-acetyltransferase 50
MGGPTAAARQSNLDVPPGHSSAHETGQSNLPSSIENRLSPLPITWAPLCERNLMQLQVLNGAIFPVKYNDRFYTEALTAPRDFVRLAHHCDLLVGAVCCRKEPRSADDPAPGAKLYIMTLGVLAPYRERGIGRRLLTYVLENALASPAAADVTEIYLHVQVNNDEALSFYEHFGFSIKERIPNYYRRIEPADCFYVHKIVTPPNARAAADEKFST